MCFNMDSGSNKPGHWCINSEIKASGPGKKGTRISHIPSPFTRDVSLFIDSFCNNKSTKRLPEREAWDILIYDKTFVWFFKAQSPPKQTSNWKIKMSLSIYLNYHKLLICIWFHLNNTLCQATSYKTELILAPFASSVKGKHTRRWGGCCFIKGDYDLPGSITFFN